MEQKELRESLKKYLQGFDLLRNKQQVKQLKRLGFDIEHRKTHLMLVFHGKNKVHQIPVPATTSDRKMYLNLVSKIMRKIGDDL
jgi:hypothetical protein